MPVQVNEIIIRATVSEGGDAQQQAQPKAGTGNGSGTSDKDSIVAECVEQVLDILKKEIKR
jgi:hypothetical protein